MPKQNCNEKLTSLLKTNPNFLLYANLSEIEDTDYEVSEENKVLNKAFYEE